MLGSKNLEQVGRAVRTVALNVKGAGIPVKAYPTCEVQNIVASADLGQPINLTSVVISLGLERVE